MKRKIELSLDNEEKSTLLRILEKYKQELMQVEEQESRSFTLAVISEEMNKVNSVMEQIRRQWNECLPSLVDTQQAMQEIVESLTDLRYRKIGGLYGFTTETKAVEVTYDTVKGYIVKVAGQTVLESKDVREACLKFQSLTV